MLVPNTFCDIKYYHFFVNYKDDKMRINDFSITSNIANLLWALDVKVLRKRGRSLYLGGDYHEEYQEYLFLKFVDTNYNTSRPC